MLKKLKVNQRYIQRNNLHCKWDNYSRMEQENFWKKAFKKIEGI